MTVGLCPLLSPGVTSAGMWFWGRLDGVDVEVGSVVFEITLFLRDGGKRAQNYCLQSSCSGWGEVVVLVVVMVGGT